MLNRSARTIFRLGVLAAALLHAAPASSQIFLDRTGFENAIGQGFQLEGFESVPLDGNGNAAGSNAATYGGGAITWESLSLASDVDLIRFTTDTGLDGTLLLGESPGESSTSVVGSPGGDGAGGAEADDDFRIDFATPVEAAGIQIFNNSQTAGESVEFRDATDAVLASTALPNQDGFVSYVVAPGESRIAAIVVDESSAGGDDIRFDDILWKVDGARPQASAGQIANPHVNSWRRILEAEVPASELETAGEGFATGAGVGDINGDGVPDLVIGDYRGQAVGSPADTGQIWLLMMGRDKSVKKVQRINDLEGGLSGPDNPGGYLPTIAWFGSSVEGIGDLDGDGVPEIAAGRFSSPRFHILFMNSDGTVRDLVEIGQGEAWGSGGAIARLGDLDGDGITELAVQGTSANQIFILFMNADGTVRAEQEISATAGNFGGTLVGGDAFGSSLVGIGDLNRDGLPDVAVGASGTDEGPGFFNVGAVWILFLASDGTVKAEQKISTAAGGFEGTLLTYNYLQGLDSNDNFGTDIDWLPTPKAATSGILLVSAHQMQGFFPDNELISLGATFTLPLNEDGTVADTLGISRIPTEGPFIADPSIFDPPKPETDLFGAPTVIGDVDNDGVPEVLIAATAGGGPGVNGAGYLFSIAGVDLTSYADAVAEIDAQLASFNGAVTQDEAEDMLGVPTNDGTVLFTGPSSGVYPNQIPSPGSITVQFVDNFASGDGSSESDVLIHRHISDVVGSVTGFPLTVYASEDGQTFTQVFHDSAMETVLQFGPLLLEYTRVGVDLDSGGFGSTSQVSFIRIEQEVVVGCGPVACQLPRIDPQITAVEALQNHNLIADDDFDNFPNGLDNCPFQPNPTQTDSDADGSGDICDNCPAVSNSDQFDGDGDGFGDPCDAGTLRLVEVPAPSPTWELRLRCSGDGTAVDRLNFGIVVPPAVSPSSAFFGGATGPTSCEEPFFPPPNPPPGFVPGSGCAAASELGVTVDKTDSAILGPGLTGPAGVRSDSIYTVFFPEDPLASFCEPNQEVAIGRLHFAAPLGGETAVPTVTSRGVGALGLSNAIDPDFRVDPNVGIVELDLRPAPGEPTGAEVRWEVCVEAEGEINRLSLAFEAPAGTSTADMRWLGCDSAPDGNLRRSCSGFASQYAGKVRPTGGCATCPSYTEGPDASDPVPTLYVVLEGNQPNDDTLFINTPGECDSLGQVELLGSPGIPPDLSINGLEGLATQPPILAAVIPLEEVSTLDVALSSAQGASSEDTDNDAVIDEDDNCPFLQNTSQTNTGGLLSSVPNDNIGDDCTCGDLDFDGRMLPAGPDLPILIDVLLGLNTSPAVLNRASVVDGKEANIRDAVYLALGLDGKLPGFDQVCEDGVLPLP